MVKGSPVSGSIPGYRYAGLTLAGQTGAVGWAVSYHDTSSGAESLFHTAAVQPRVVLSLNFEF